MLWGKGKSFDSGSLLHQMLQAFDFLVSIDILHRDVKPENILFVTTRNGYHYQLADFGLCNEIVNAKSLVGSKRYMAPEILKGEQQTPKADIYSLYVTMLDALDIRGFRNARHESPTQVQEMVAFLSREEAKLFSIRGMGDRSPDRRASAAEILVKCFDGIGLTTSYQVQQTISTHEQSAMVNAVPKLSLARPGPSAQTRRPIRVDLRSEKLLLAPKVMKQRYSALQKKTIKVIDDGLTGKLQRCRMPGAFPHHGDKGN